MVDCGKRIFDDAEHDTLVNPVLIVEALSPATEDYDRGGKFDHYKYIKSLAGYILVVKIAIVWNLNFVLLIVPTSAPR